MNRSRYLASALSLRCNSRHFASSRGKMDFPEKMLWSKLKSTFRDLPPASALSAATPKAKHCFNNLNITGTTPYPKLYSTSCSSLRCYRQRLCPDLVTRRPQYFQQEQRRTCHSWTSIRERETVSGAVTKLMEKFAKEDIPEPDVSAEYIVAHVLGVRQLSEFARIDQSRILSTEERSRVMELASQKLARVPMQYILGEWDFRDLTLKMKAPVFIPRPETEMLVDLLVSYYEEDDELDILEVGCGSGAIGLSLLHEFQKAHVTAIDASRDAVMLTQDNASRLGVSNRLSVHHTALTDESPLRIHSKYGTRYDVIVSNPPYLFTRDMDDLGPEILRNEDPMALDAGAEGMDVIKAIVKHARFLLKPRGFIWLETDTRHHQMIQEWLVEHPAFSVQFNDSFLDFTDRTRFCQLQYAP
eukprot:XP_011680897.1 PREDICTED: hemK methyltransferase family member 1 [Strongylocentrotus purpuratus]